MSKLAHPMRCTVRYGSSVPGPLEARRRSTGRRMGGAATTGGFNGLKDPGVLASFGLVSQGYNRYLENQVNWQPPGFLSDNGKQKPWEEQGLPPWLLQAHKPESAPSVIESLIPLELRTENGSLAGCTKGQTLAEWKEKLQECDSLASIRSAANQQISSLEPDISECALQRLKEIDPPLSSYLEFLGDPILNSPNAGNTTAFLQLLTWRKTTGDLHGKLARRCFRKVQRWTSKEICLGNITETEICAILRASSRSSGPMYCEKPGRIFEQIYLTIWEGVRDSQIRSIRDFQPTTLRLLFRAAAQSSDTDLGLATAHEMISSLLPHGRQQSSQAIKMFASSFFEGSFGPFSHRFQKGQNMARSEALFQALRSLPMDCVFDGIESLITSRLNRANAGGRLLSERQVDRLRCYFHVLTKLEHEKRVCNVLHTSSSLDILERKIAGSEPDILSLYLETRGVSSICEFLLDHWFVPRLATFLAQHGRSNINGRNLSDLRNDCIQQISKENSEGKQPPYLVLVCYMFGVAPAIFVPLIPKLFSLLRYMTDAKTLALVAKEIQSLRIYVPLDDLHSTINYLAPQDCKAALSLFLKDPRSRLECCKALADTIFDSPLYHNNVLFSLMLHPKRFNYDDKTSIPSQISNRRLFIHRLSARLFRSQDASPGRALRTFRRLFPRVEARRSGKHESLAPALINSALLPWLRAGRSVPYGVKQWVFGQLEAMKGRDASEEVYEAVKTWETKIMQRRKSVLISGTAPLPLFTKENEPDLCSPDLEEASEITT